MSETVSDEIGEDGLTAHERAFLTTPMSQMKLEERLAAFSIREKRDNKYYAENAEYRAWKDAESKARISGT